MNQASSHILGQLVILLNQISDEDFVTPSVSLSGSTIGQHLRHTLEFFLCFRSGFETGVVNYDKRCHDKQIETERAIALKTVEEIRKFISNIDYSRKLVLEVGYQVHSDEYLTIPTTAVRELVYNIEHCVHHMAIMKIGIRELAPYISLPNDFGVAASTMRYHAASVTK